MLDAGAMLMRHQSLLWRASTMLAVLIAVAAVTVLHAGEQRRVEALGKLERTRAFIERSGGERVAAQATNASFVALLPEAVDAEPIVQRVSAAALLNAVTLVDSRVERARARSTSELSRASLAFSLRGSYPAIKATLADTLTRTGNATLQSLSIRRDGKLEVEAQVVLSLWLQPASPTAQAN